MCYHYITPHFYYIYITLLFNKRISLNKILGQMTNRDLLKEAIADAKAVKETAIANAKAALEEAFTPHLKSMLAAKLEEMDKDEDVEEAMKAKEEKDMMEEFEVNEGKDEMDEEFDLNEILAELEGGGDEEEEMEAGEEEIEAGEEAEMEAGEMGDEEVDLEDMTEDDLKSFIEDVIADMVAAGELEAGEEMEAEDEMGDMEELEEMDDVSWNEKNNPARGATLDKLAPTKVGQTTSAYAVNENEEVEESLADPQLLDIATGVAGLIGSGAGLAYVIDALKSGKAGKAGAALANALEKTAGAAGVNKPTGTKMMEEKEEVEEVTGASGGYDPSMAAGAGLENIINSVTALIKKGGPAAKKAYAVLQQLGAGAAAGMKEGEEEMDQMEELKKELQEVNLLNAKLLYTNKIFNAKNLNESQKLKVLKAFDKATSVKEAKVIYETLNEGMASKTQKPSFVNEIKGRASKATGFISESKNPIVEVDPMVTRWQKLAGIK